MFSSFVQTPTRRGFFILQPWLSRSNNNYLNFFYRNDYSYAPPNEFRGGRMQARDRFEKPGRRVASPRPDAACRPGRGLLFSIDRRELEKAAGLGKANFSRALDHDLLKTAAEEDDPNSACGIPLIRWISRYRRRRRRRRPRRDDFLERIVPRINTRPAIPAAAPGHTLSFPFQDRFFLTTSPDRRIVGTQGRSLNRLIDRFIIGNFIGPISDRPATCL